METVSKNLKVAVEEGWIDTKFEGRSVKGLVREIGYGVDAGSTSTRCRTFSDEDGEYSENYEINSDIVLVGDISTIKSNTPSVYSNLELIVKDTTESKEQKMFTEEHFVKCELAIGKAGSDIMRASGISKTKNKATYLNIITLIALKELLNETKEVADVVEATVACSLPPEDFKSLKTLDFFKSNLAGNYEVNFVRLGVTIKVNIDKETIYLEKEPNAVLFSLASEDESLLDENCIVVDGGGKSDDLSIAVEGRILEEYSKTLLTAGSNLCMNISETYMQETGKSMPPVESIKAALVNGILTRGGKETDIFEIIDSCKKETANAIFNGIISLLDRASKSIDDIGVILYHGRLMEDTISGSRKSSISDYINEQVSQLTEVKSVKTVSTDCITEGVILSRWTELYA